MHDIALDLLILLAGIWLVAVTLRPIGLPTVMGELIVGVVVGPAVLNLIEPTEAITLLAEIGIFFLMFHAGVETQPLEFFDALKRSMGVAIVGALVPFTVAFTIATAFGLTRVGATFVGLTMTATAVVITLTALKDLGLAQTRVARVIIASCVIDDLLTMVVFGVMVGVLTGGTFEPMAVGMSLAKVLVFLAILFLVGQYVYPLLTLPFRSEGGKGFTFVLLTAIGAGLFAEAIGLHMILGAYLAGLFFGESVAHPNLLRVVKDRAYGIAYSFLGPIFFISLGFSITFDISPAGWTFLIVLTLAVIVGQILSAGGMALRMGLPRYEALTVGVGMCGRAELAFILAALALTQGAIEQSVFSVLIFTAFLLNLFTPLALKGCADLLQGQAAPVADATRGLVQFDKFEDVSLSDQPTRRLSTRLPALDNSVVVYGHGPEVETLLSELEEREIPVVMIEEDEVRAQRLIERGLQVVLSRPAEGEIDLAPLGRAKALVTNTSSDRSAIMTMSAREHGFTGPVVGMIKNPTRRSVMTVAGATAVFTPRHVLAAALAARASNKISPRLAGAQLLDQHLEIAELRVHRESPLADRTPAEAAIRERTGANIIGQWNESELGPPPPPDQPLTSGTLLIAAGSPESIRTLRQLARPIPEHGPIVVIGFGVVGQKVHQVLTDAGEDTFVLAADASEGIEVEGDVFDPEILDRTPIRKARAVILAMTTQAQRDDETVLATKFLRNYAPEVPILAGVALGDQVERVQQAGADYALSLSHVAGQILARFVLGETLSLQTRLRLIKIRSERLAGRRPLREQIREDSGCTVVAIEHDGEIQTEIPSDYVLDAEDALYLCGTVDALSRFREKFGVKE